MVYGDATIDRYLAEQDYKQLVKSGSLAVPLESLSEDALPFVIAAEDEVITRSLGEIPDRELRMMYRQGKISKAQMEIGIGLKMDAEEKTFNDQTFVEYAKKHPDLVNTLDTDDSKWLFTGVFMGVFVGAAATIVGNYISEFLIDRVRATPELIQPSE